MKHTIETVRQNLPKVQVKLDNGKIITANISGRKCAFATVWTKNNHEGWQFSWQAIVNSLNNEKPLII